MQTYIEQFQLQEVMHAPLLQSLLLATYEKGAIIIQQGEQPQYVYFLVEGRVKVFASSDEGKKLILAFNRPFSVIGDIEFFQRAPYLNTVEAITDVTMLKLPLLIVQQYGMQHLPFMTFILDTLTRKFYINANASRFNLMYSVEVRLASYLLSMTTQGETVSIHHLRDAADLIGTSYRHLNRIIGQLCAEGYIERKDRAIRILDRASLYELAKQNIYEER